MSNPVVISDYDPAWRQQFDQLKKLFEPWVGHLLTRIEHVGSTSVPGLPAKPIIDLDLVIASQTDFEKTKSALAELGYLHRGDLGIAGREAFATPSNSIPHHLYVCAEDGEEFKRHIAFRDKLRCDQEVAGNYAELKKALAVKFRYDREAYTEAKSDFIQAQLAMLFPNGVSGGKSE